MTRRSLLLADSPPSRSLQGFRAGVRHAGEPSPVSGAADASVSLGKPGGTMPLQQLPRPHRRVASLEPRSESKCASAPLAGGREHVGGTEVVLDEAATGTTP